MIQVLGEGACDARSLPQTGFHYGKTQRLKSLTIRAVDSMVNSVVHCRS
jgi:hypothetical protein